MASTLFINPLTFPIYVMAKSNSLPAQCRHCRYLQLCNGECPKNRISTTNYGEYGLNYLCQGLQQYFRHVLPYMEYMAEELRHERPPANVMRSAPGKTVRELRVES